MFEVINTHLCERLNERKKDFFFFPNFVDLPDIHRMNKNYRRQRLYYRKNQLLEKKLIVFIALIRSFRSRSTNAYIDDRLLCRSVRLCSKEFFHRLFFLLTMNVHIYIYIHMCVQSLLFLSRQQCPRRKERRDARRERKKRK
jgi:hypothetical protein